MSSLLDRPDIVSEFPYRHTHPNASVARSRIVFVQRDGDMVRYVSEIIQDDGSRRMQSSEVPLVIYWIEMRRAITAFGYAVSLSDETTVLGEAYRDLAKAARAFIAHDVIDAYRSSAREAAMALESALAAVEKIENPAAESAGS